MVLGDLDSSPTGQGISPVVGWRIEVFGLRPSDGPGCCKGCEAAEDGESVVGPGPGPSLWVGWFCGIGILPRGDPASECGEAEGGVEEKG